MTNEERKNLIEEIGDAIESFPIDDTENMSIAVLAIAERRIREDCAEIARHLNGWGNDCGKGGHAEHIAAAILASIPKERDDRD